MINVEVYPFDWVRRTGNDEFGRVPRQALACRMRKVLGGIFARALAYG